MEKKRRGPGTKHHWIVTICFARTKAGLPFEEAKKSIEGYRKKSLMDLYSLACIAGTDQDLAMKN